MEFSNEQIQEILSNEETRGNFLETIANTEQGKSYLENHAKTHFDNNVGSKIGEIHGGYDKDLSEATGITKPDGVKSYVFWKDEISKLTEKAKASDPNLLETLKSKNEELQKQLDNNEGTKYFKDLLESTKTTAQAEIEKYKEELQNYKTNEINFKINTELNSTISKFNFDETIKKTVLDTYIKTELNKLSSKAKVSEDGSVTYYDDSGEIIVNRKTMLKADADYILNERLKDVLAEKRMITGGGGDGKAKGKKSTGNFGGAKNQQELNGLIADNLLADGYIKGSEKYNEMFSELLKANKGDLPLR